MRDDLPLDIAEECAHMLVAMNRAPAPERWVPEIHEAAMAQANLKNLEAIF